MPKKFLFRMPNKYNELSQLENKKVGGISLGSPLQSIDYKYNIRGWMTRINDPKNLVNGKLFGYEIKYNQIEGLETPNLDYTDLKVKAKYNGNIAEVDWRTSTTQGDNLRRYGYVYDSLNRLQAGFYQKDTNPSAKEYFEKISYDLNGNITNLKRSEGLQGGSIAMTIDDLSYTYTGNRLNTVTDLSGQYSGYPDTSGNQIAYDDNGNIKDHRDKGILQIDYNFLNLPNYLKFDKGLAMRNGMINENTYYTYRADGVKLKKIYNFAPPNPSGTVTSLLSKITEYVDGFQYEGSKANVLKLKFVPTVEGYYNFENNKYIYNYTDHLGNVRLSYFNNGIGIEVLEENNYYPFGLKHEGYNILTGNPAYKYQYNGKELQQETGQYDYGARMYMPDIGRWGVVDPLAETSRRWSPYTYAYNNPINFIDPDGRQGLGWGLKDGEWKFVQGMQEGDATYQQGGYTDFRADGTVEPNVEISNSSAENTGMTYLGFNGEAHYVPTDGSNGSTGMLGLSNWFRDALAAITPSFGNPEEFPIITNPNGIARTDFDASTHDKLRPGDKTFILDWGSFVAPNTFPANGSKGGPTWAGRVYAGTWAINGLMDAYSAVFGGKKDSDTSLNSMSVKVTSLDSIKSTGFTYQKDTIIFYGNKSGDFDRAYKPVQDSSYNRDIRNFNSRVPSQYRINKRR